MTDTTDDREGSGPRSPLIALALLTLVAASAAAVLWRPQPRTAEAREATGVPAESSASRDDRGHGLDLRTDGTVVGPHRGGESAALGSDPSGAEVRHQASPAARPGHLTGIVVDPSGKAVPGVEARVRRGQREWSFGSDGVWSDGEPTVPDDPSSGSAPSDSVGGPPREVTIRTDELGRFEVPVGPGAWRIDVSAAGFAPWWRDHLSAGESIRIDLRAPLTIEVTVRDVGGAALADVPVRLLENFRLPWGPTIALGRTGDDGTVRLPADSRESFYPCVHLDGMRYVVQRLDRPAWAGGALRTEVVCEPGEELRGRVTVSSGAGDDGTPPPRVRVEGYSRGQSIQLEPALAADGTFATPPLFAPGESVRVTANADGRGEVQAWTLIAAPDGDAARAATGTSIELALRDRERRARARVTDRNGAPLGEVRVLAVSIDPIEGDQDTLAMGLMRVPAYHERWIPVGTTDRRGRLEVAGLGSDLEYVLALVPPASSGLATGFAWIPAGPPGAVVDLGSQPLAASVALSGSLRYRDGEPAAGQTLSVQRKLVVPGDQLSTWRPSHWWRPRLATARSDGSFRVADLPAGTYDLRLEGELLTTVDLGESSPTTTLPLRIDREAPPASQALLRGITTAADGRPVAQAFVALFDPDDAARRSPLAMTFTDLDGRFVLSGAGDRPVQLHVADPRGRYLDRSQGLERLSEAGPMAIVLESAPAPSEPVLVFVMDPEGRPLEGADVRLEPPENRYCGCLSFDFKSDPHGFVEVQRVADKDHALTISDPLGRYPPKRIDAVRPGAYVDVSLGRD